jgi:hypothetical protein
MPAKSPSLARDKEVLMIKILNKGTTPRQAAMKIFAIALIIGLMLLASGGQASAMMRLLQHWLFTALTLAAGVVTDLHAWFLGINVALAFFWLEQTLKTLIDIRRELQEIKRLLSK